MVTSWRLLGIGDKARQSARVKEVMDSEVHDGISDKRIRIVGRLVVIRIEGRRCRLSSSHAAIMRLNRGRKFAKTLSFGLSQ